MTLDKRGVRFILPEVCVIVITILFALMAIFAVLQVFARRAEFREIYGASREGKFSLANLIQITPKDSPPSTCFSTYIMSVCW
jgi:hypothetical protein